MFTIGPTSGIDLPPARTPVGPVPSHRRYHVRKVAVGLLGLSLTATGLAFGPSASAAPQPKLPAAAPAAAEPQALKDELPNKLEEKRRALRQQGLSDVLSGAARPRSATAARSSRSARPARPARAGANARTAAGSGQQTKDQYVELEPRADRQDLRDPGRVRQRAAPELPGPGHRPGHRRARPRSTVRCTTRSPSPTGRWTTPPSGRPDYSAGLLPPALLRHQPGRRVAQAVLRGPVLGSLQRRRRGHRLGQGQVQRGPLRPHPKRLPRARCAHVCTNTWALVRDAANQWVADQKAAGPDRRADRRRAEVVRPVGPLRLRRRRQLQRAGRLHRPLPDRPRRRRPGRR